MANLDAQLTKNLLTALGLENKDSETQQKIIAQVGEIIFKKVILKVMELLPENELDNFKQVLEEEKNNPGTTLDFLREKIGNFDQIVAEQVAEFKTESEELMQAAKNQGQL